MVNCRHLGEFNGAKCSQCGAAVRDEVSPYVAMLQHSDVYSHAIARPNPPNRVEVDCATTAALLVRQHLNESDTWHQENFVVLLLDARSRVLKVETVARGTLTACLVHPREVYRAAIVNGAASIIVAHNHPSGDASPSDEDRILTDRLERAGEVLGIPMVDHIVVTQKECVSLSSAVSTF